MIESRGLQGLRLFVVPGTGATPVPTRLDGPGTWLRRTVPRVAVMPLMTAVKRRLPPRPASGPVTSWHTVLTPSTEPGRS